MNLTDQVCSLELAKRLKELGVRQESYFVWLKQDHDRYEYDVSERWNIPSDRPFSENDYSAFTVAELGEMLPIHIINKKGYLSKLSIEIEEDEYKSEKRKYWIGYGSLREKTPLMYSCAEETEANARASMLVYLIEQGLLNVADISKHT